MLDETGGGQPIDDRCGTHFLIVLSADVIL